MMKQAERDEQIAEILKWFNFKRVLTTMQVLHWGYTDCRWQNLTVPRLKETADRLLRELSPASQSLSSGGFVAYWAGKGKLGLTFSLCDYEVE